MKTILFAMMMVFAVATHAGSKEEAAESGDGDTAAKSIDQENCFTCNNGVMNVGPENPRVTAQNRATDVFGKKTDTPEGDTDAVKEGKGK